MFHHARALRRTNIKQIKDHQALFTHGAIGQWTVPKSTGRDYFVITRLLKVTQEGEKVGG